MIKYKIKGDTLYIGGWFLRRKIKEVPAKAFYPFLLKNKNWECENCLNTKFSGIKTIRTNLPILSIKECEEISLHLLKKRKPKVYEELVSILLNLGFRLYPQPKSEYEEYLECCREKWRKEEQERRRLSNIDQ